MTTDSEIERENKAANRVLDILDRWDERMRNHQTQKRQHPRRKFRAQVTIYIPESTGIAGESAEATSFSVWTRDLSQAGMCFIYRGTIKARKIVVCLNPDAGGTLWFQAEIVRQRLVHNDFWEYGARFTGPASL